MKIAIDKESLSAMKQDGNEYVYLFYDEPYRELYDLGIHCIRWDMCGYVDVNLTKYDLDCFKKATINEADYDKLPEKHQFKIGIIIPNYNYEHTIDKCLSSIVMQTYKNYQVVFVDDCSTDNSVSIARNYTSRLNEITIVELKQKRYNGGARNEGYLYLDADIDYVWYVDSDDWLEDEDVLQKINNRLQRKPDVLFIGMSMQRNGMKTVAFTPNYIDKYEAFSGWSGSCGKVIKKELATRQECLYNEGTLKEDKNQHCKICFYMTTFALLKDPIYVWNRENMKSVTTVRDRIIWGSSTIRHYADTLQFALSIKGLDPKIDRLMDERVMMTKREMENGGDKQW